MGNTIYSSDARATRSMVQGYETKTRAELFVETQMTEDMNPKGVTIRESRDSEAHPNSVPIIIALDVTGSMGTIPHSLLQKGLPTIMSGIIQAGIPDPQVMFMAIGDHECDKSPLQVAQFESGDAELDKWLTEVYLESGGGGNAGESYHLAWYFAANHTVTDSLEKRGEKGYLFTIGDEPVLENLPKDVLMNIMGGQHFEDSTALELLEAAEEKYNVYHIHTLFTRSGSRKHVQDGWKQIMSDRCLRAKSIEHIPQLITNVIVNENLTQNVIQQEIL